MEHDIYKSAYINKEKEKRKEARKEKALNRLNTSFYLITMAMSSQIVPRHLFNIYFWRGVSIVLDSPS